MELKKNLSFVQRLLSCSTWLSFRPVAKAVNAQEIIDHIVSEASIYAAQKWRIFLTSHEELKAFPGICYLIGINKSPSVANYWDVDHYIGNDGIKTVMTQQRFQDILENLHLANNDYYGKSDKGRAVYIIFGNIDNVVVVCFRALWDSL